MLVEVHGPQGGRVRCTVHREGGWDGEVSSSTERRGTVHREGGWDGEVSSSTERRGTVHREGGWDEGCHVSMMKILSKGPSLIMLNFLIVS